MIDGQCEDFVIRKGHSIKKGNKFFKRVEQLGYLEENLTDRNSIQEAIKARLKSKNACFHTVQNLLSSNLVSKKIKILIHRTIMLPVVMYWCEIWSLTLREEHSLRVFENRVVRRIFGLGRTR